MDTIPQISRPNLFKHVSSWLPILALISLAILLWLPFGLHIGFYADEWTTMLGIQRGAFITRTVRPFELFAWFAAYHMSPTNLYIGMNLLLMLLIMGKGLISYRLLSDMGFNKLFAFGTAALLVLYPADSGVFYMGALSIHASVLLYLVAVWLLVRFWLSNRCRLWIPIVFVTGLCVGIYEGIYPLIFLAPLVLVYLQRGVTRRVVVTSLLWFSVPFLFFLRLTSILLLNSSTDSYQSSLLASDHSVGTILASLLQANRYSLMDSWVSATHQIFANSGWAGWRNIFKTMSANPFLIYALVIAGIIAVTGIVLARVRQPLKTPHKHFVFLLLVSPLMLTFGFLLYSLTNLRDSNLRTYFHASIGAALFVSTFLWLFGGLLRRQTRIYAIGLTMLALVASSSLLLQHRGYVAQGKQQVPFLQMLVHAAPQIESGSTVVIMDETPNHELETLFNRISLYFDAAARIIYDDQTLTAVICYPDDTMGWGMYQETCRFQADSLQLLFKDQPVWTHSYDRLVIFRYQADKTLRLEPGITRYTNSEQAVRLYTPDKLLDPHGVIPIRAQTMLEMSP